MADKVHASYYCTRNDLELVAVCDSRLPNAGAGKKNTGMHPLWDDPQAMLLAVKPDVVSVCSPNRFHYEHTLMALEAGCHVMCEKPPAMTPEQAREIAIPRANWARCWPTTFTIVLRSIRNSCVNR